MATTTHFEPVEYRVALIDTSSRKMLVHKIEACSSLPRVSISPRMRPAQQIRKELLDLWGVSAFIVDLVSEKGRLPTLAVAELLASAVPSIFYLEYLEDIEDTELSDHERKHLLRVLEGNTEGSVSRLGWIDGAIAWTERTVRETVCAKASVEQYNAGSGFALIQFTMKSGRAYWLKATAGRNAHERRLTCTLAQRCQPGDASPHYLPKILDDREDWNAWLMESRGIVAPPQSPKEAMGILPSIASRLADLQVASIPHVSDLLASGASDHRVLELALRTPELFSHLHEVLDNSHGEHEVIGHRRLTELESLVLKILAALHATSLPDTIVHGDLNWGNILFAPEPQFIDWNEGHIGLPVVAFESLLMLIRPDWLDVRESLVSACKQAYLQSWSKRVNIADLDLGFKYASSVNVLTSLLGSLDRPSISQEQIERNRRYVLQSIQRLNHSVSRLDMEGSV